LKKGYLFQKATLTRKVNMTDREIVSLIQAKKLEKPIKELYKEFPSTRLTLIKYGANENQAPEIFNDSLVLLIEKVNQPNFELTAKLASFLIGICLFKLKNLLRKENRSSQFVQFSDELNQNYHLAQADFDEEKEEKLAIIDSILSTIQERCKKLLQLFYFENKSMQQIADQMNFSSMQSAKTQKYKCLEKAHEMANQQLLTLKNTVS